MSEVDVLKITNEDAAFILGKGGRTSNATPQAAVSADHAPSPCDHAAPGIPPSSPPLLARIPMPRA